MAFKIVSSGLNHTEVFIIQTAMREKLKILFYILMLIAVFALMIG